MTDGHFLSILIFYSKKLYTLNQVRRKFLERFADRNMKQSKASRSEAVL